MRARGMRSVLTVVALAVSLCGCSKEPTDTNEPDATADDTRALREEQFLEQSLSWLIEQAEKHRAVADDVQRKLEHLQESGATELEINRVRAQLNSEKQVVAAIEARVEEERQKVRR